MARIDMRLKNNPYHPDIAIFLVLIPFVSAFNYYLTYTNIRWNGFLALTYTLDTLQGYAAVWGVRMFVLYLDRGFPYSKNLVRRLLIQTPGILMVGLGIIIILTELVSLIARGKMAPLHFYTFDLFIISIWFFVVNGIYVLLHFYREWDQSKRIEETQKAAGETYLLVKSGKKNLQLDTGQVIGFLADGDYSVAVDQNGKIHLLDLSLSKVESMVDSERFFRLNRQCLCNRQFIRGFERSHNGKIEVMLEGKGFFPDRVPVSREKTPRFKEWFYLSAGRFNG